MTREVLTGRPVTGTSARLAAVPAGGWPRVGVLAVQGDFEAHRQTLAGLGVEAPEVRRPEQLDRLDALILPGGESGAHLRILQENGLFEAIRVFHARGGALYGTCAGLILLAKGVSNPPQESLGLIDLDIIRNGYGRQIDSFETDVPAPWLGRPADHPLRLVFIRAPRITRVGPDVEVLLSHDGEPVMARQGRVLVSTFHPEMAGDGAIHRWFLEQISG